MSALLNLTGERYQLLAAIKKHPGELTPRLMYADWLDEFAVSDLDVATAEFIRVSCRDRVRAQMPLAAYDWIEDNWPRLVPTALMEHHPAPSQRMPIRFGRHIWFPFRGSSITKHGFVEPWKKPRTILLYFCRGFVDAVRIYSGPAADILRPLIRQDQPLARIVGGSNP